MLAVQQGVVAGVVACVLLGAAWAFMHSTLQTWATSVAPLARAQVVPLFAACLFLGGSTGAALGGLLAGNALYGTLFAISAGLFVPLDRRVRGDPPPLPPHPKGTLMTARPPAGYGCAPAATPSSRGPAPDAP